jgi:predicted aspartyl protease
MLVQNNIKKMVAVGLLLFVFCSVLVAEPVRWNGPAGSRIKAIHRFKKDKEKQDPISAAAASVETTSSIPNNLIQSPPIDGFVPWMVVVATNRRESEDDWAAVPESYVRGSFPAGVNPQNDFMIGIFDTGASAHVLGHQNAVTAGLFNSTYLTSNTTVISGVTGSVDAWVSKPLALYMEGLDVLEPNSPSDPEVRLPSTSGMKGQSNISVIIGDEPGIYPDIQTAIGSPMSLYYITHIQTSKPVTIVRNGTTYTAPTITFYDKDDTAAPSYPNKVPLELKPLGALNVQYTPTIDFLNFNYDPATPSVIIGNSAQSLFFVHSVDLQEGSKNAYDKDRFMLDTGAQITVIGSRIAARLGLNPVYKEFEVEIEGVTGESIMAPGFYVDSITIPAIGQWLEYADVPVVLLDIASPEGGTLDGIIGMNLFTEYNLIFRGGGVFLQEDPALEFQRIGEAMIGDIAPPSGDGVVDLLDFAVFSKAWLASDTDANWNLAADFIASGLIDLPDLVVLANNWLSGATP